MTNIFMDIFEIYLRYLYAKYTLYILGRKHGDSTQTSHKNRQEKAQGYAAFSMRIATSHLHLATLSLSSIGKN